jgi:hypothetical protein
MERITPFVPAATGYVSLCLGPLTHFMFTLCCLDLITCRWRGATGLYISLAGLGSLCINLPAQAVQIGGCGTIYDDSKIEGRWDTRLTTFGLGLYCWGRRTSYEL